MIILDTSVLSLAFRRRPGTLPEPPAAGVLRRLIVEDQPLAIPGIVMQELLSGVRSPEQFSRLGQRLGGFPLLIASRADHVTAARLTNTCRGTGIAVTTIDCLIAALTIAAGGQLFTADEDFRHMAACCKLKLFSWP